MSRSRSIRLLIHLNRSQASYALVHRTESGRDHTDRRLEWGLLPYAVDEPLPHDVLALLQRAVWDMMRKRDPGALPRSGPGAPGGVGGRPHLQSVGLVSGHVPHAGDPLDVPLPGL